MKKSRDTSFTALGIQQNFKNSNRDIKAKSK